MASGFRIASAYVDVHLDREALPAELEAMARDLETSSDVAGKSAGKRIGDGIGKGVGDAPVAEPATRKGTEAGGRFGDAFSTRVGAALKSLPPADINLDDEYAQAKLDFIREELKGLSSQRIGIDISEADAIAKLTVLREQLDTLRTISPSIGVKVDTAAASAEIDRFLASTEVKAEVAGKAAGEKLSSGMAGSARTMSPLIVSAIAGGLIAGGPAISAAGILLFGGLAAAAASNVGSVQDSFRNLGAHVMNDVQGIAQQTSGEFVGMAGDIQAGFDRVEPAIRSAMTAGAVDIHQVVDALVGAADTAIPAFTRALQQGQPVVQGLAALIRDLGSGVAGLMDNLTAHSSAEGAVLSDLGQTINILLPAIGQLLGEGAELGRDVLPIVNTGLHLLSGVLNLIAPVLPEVAMGFAAFKVVGLLSGPLTSLATGLENVGAKAGVMVEGLTGSATAGEKVMSGFGKASTAASGFAGALGPIGAVAGVAAFGIGLITNAIVQHDQQVQQDTHTLLTWYQAIATGGAGASQAMQNVADKQKELSVAQDKLNQLTAQQNVVYQEAGRGAGAYSAVINEQKGKVSDLTKEFHDAWAQLTPTEQAQVKLNEAIDKYGPGSLGAAAAAANLNSILATSTTTQDAATKAADAAAVATGTQTQRLQALAGQASQANSAISLMNSALAALTGANVTAAQAEDNITTALNAVTTATQGQTGAVMTNTGEINHGTGAGVALDQSLQNLGTTMQNQISVMAQSGAGTDTLNQKSQALWQQFVTVAMHAGLTQQAAQNLATAYYGIPGQVVTTIIGNPTPALVGIQQVQNALAQLHDKTITVTTYNKMVSTGPAGIGLASAGPHALGSIMMPMATGGVIRAMAAGADIFEPNNPTVLIGDNRRVRESFIPQDDSPRSKAILTETASAMGYGLTPTTGSGQTNGGPSITVQSMTVQVAGTVDFTRPGFADKIAEPIQQALVRLERSRR